MREKGQKEKKVRGDGEDSSDEGRRVVGPSGS